MSRKKETAEDVEEQMRRKFLAKCRFRAIGRMVMENVPWLIESSDDYEGVEDTQRRIRMAVYGATKKKLLQITDKALLCKAVDERTPEELSYLYKKIGNIKCFKRYPPSVRKHLAAVARFRFYGANRVIVRESEVSHAFYYVVTGELKYSKIQFDPVLDKEVSADIDFIHTGECFGDSEVLHNLVRPLTVSSISEVELLMITKDDFNDIVQKVIEQDWNKIREAMAVFSYFDTYDEIGIKDGCVNAKMKTFQRDETIYGDGIGVENYAYFILTGECQMIENMKISFTKRLGKYYFRLIEEPRPKVKEEVVEELDFDQKYFNRKRSATLLSSKLPTKSFLNTRATSSDSGSSLEITHGSKIGQSIVFKEKTASSSEEEEETVCELGDMLTHKKDPPNVRTLFMQVCILVPGATFGLGENMRNRRIVALTPTVDCMLFPVLFLMERNYANIWTRIRHFLDKKIPTTRQLFNDFATNMKWKAWREQLVEDVVARMNLQNFTTKHDVPYSIRVRDDFVI